MVSCCCYVTSLVRKTCDRIYWGWVVCFAFLLLFTVAAGVAFSFAEIFVPISKEIRESYSLLSWAGALPGSLPMLIAPVATWLHYRISARILVVVGVLMTSVSLSVLAAVRHVEVMLVLHGFISGFGLMCVVNAPFYVLEQYFPYEHKRHVLATSLIACGFPLATLIFNPLINDLLEARGWRVTYCVLAAILLAVGLPAAVTFRSPQNQDTDSSSCCVESAMHDHSSVNHPSTSINSNGGAVSQHYEPTCIAIDTPLKSRGSSVVTPTRTKVLLTSVWLIVSTLKAIGYYTPIFTLVKQMDVLHISQWDASRAMSLVGFCELVSRTGMSLVGDRFKGRIIPVYVICAAALSIQNIFGAYANTYNQLLIYAIALGLCAGPIIAAMYSSCSEVLFGQHVPELFSLFRTGLGLGALFGPTIAGAIYDSTWSFRGVYYFNACTYAVTAILYAVLVMIKRCKPVCLFPPVESQQTTYGTENAEYRTAPEDGEYIVYDRENITKPGPAVSQLAENSDSISNDQSMSHQIQLQEED